MSPLLDNGQSILPSHAQVELAALFQVEKKNWVACLKRSHIYVKFDGESIFDGLRAVRGHV